MLEKRCKFFLPTNISKISVSLIRHIFCFWFNIFIRASANSFLVFFFSNYHKKISLTMNKQNCPKCRHDKVIGSYQSVHEKKKKKENKNCQTPKLIATFLFTFIITTINFTNIFSLVFTFNINIKKR